MALGPGLVEVKFARYNAPVYARQKFTPATAFLKGSFVSFPRVSTPLFIDN